ncbi:hypothetical protein D3C86_1252700 [compost metagenome]
MIEIAPVPVAAPIMFGVVFPIETFPPSTEIPAKIPGAVVAPLVVVKEIAVTVFPWIEEAVPVLDAVNSIPNKRLVKAPL